VRPDRKGNAPDLKSWADCGARAQAAAPADRRRARGLHDGAAGAGLLRQHPQRAEIEAAYNKLKELMPNVKVFNAESPKDAYLSGEVRLGMI